MKNGTEIAASESDLHTANGDSTVTVCDSIEVVSPQRWDVDDPCLYTLEADIVENGRVVDTNTVDIGFRTFYFDADKMPPHLVCDLRRGGEVMTVWGSTVPRRVKHILSGVENKDSMLLLRDENNAVYLLGSLRRSALAEVNENTKNTLKISVKR